MKRADLKVDYHGLNRLVDALSRAFGRCRLFPRFAVSLGRLAIDDYGQPDVTGPVKLQLSPKAAIAALRHKLPGLDISKILYGRMPLSDFWPKAAY